MTPHENRMKRFDGRGCRLDCLRTRLRGGRGYILVFPKLNVSTCSHYNRNSLVTGGVGI